MALIKCTEYGAEISDKATACPKCGCPVGLNPAVVPGDIDNDVVPSTSKKKSRKWLWALLAVFVVVGAASAAWFIFFPQDMASVLSGKKQEPTVKITPEFCNAVRKYNELTTFREGFAAVKNGEKWGFINTEGKEVVPCKYDKVEYFSEGIAAVEKGEKWGFVNTEGKEVIPCIYNDVQSFQEGLAGVLKKDKWGFVDKDGNVVIPFKFHEDQTVGPLFSQGVAFVHADTDNNGKYKNCFIDKTGKVVLTLADKYDVDYARGWEPTFNEDKVCCVHVEDGDIVYLDMQGNEVKGYKEKPHAEPCYEKYEGRNGKVGIKDKKTGKYIIPAKYDDILTDFNNGVALAELKYNRISSGPSGYSEETIRIYGYVDIEGNETFTSDDYVKVAKENNEATLEKSRLDYEAEQPRWLQGEWFFRSSNGTCYVRIEGDNILVAFGQDVSYDGPYTIEDDNVIYDRHDGMYCYFPIDRNREVLMMDENNPMYRSADEANSACRSYNSGRSSSNCGYSGRNAHPFETDGDVLDFTSGTFYNSEGTRLSLKYNGMYVNGVNSLTTSTVVTSFSGMYARVKVNAIPNGVFTFTVDKANGTITDMEGGVWRKK